MRAQPSLQRDVLPHLEAFLATGRTEPIPSCQKSKAVASHGRLKRELSHHTPVTGGREDRPRDLLERCQANGLAP